MDWDQIEMELNFSAEKGVLNFSTTIALKWTIIETFIRI